MTRRYEEACGDCRFFWSGASRCRRYPPQANRGEWSYPHMEATDWCGEFQREPGVAASVGTAPKPSFSHGRAKAVIETVRRPTGVLIR